MIIIFILILCSLCFAQDTLIRWEPEVNLTQDTVYNFSPWIECKDNYVHIAWEELDNGVYYQRSIDYGSIWSQPIRLHTDTTMVIDPKLALGGENVYCVWDAGYSGGWYLRFTRSTDSGETWDSIITLDDSVCGKARIAASGDTVFVAEHIQDTIRFYLRRSFDGGVNWSSRYPIIARPPLYYPGLFYVNSILHLAFNCADTLFYMYSTDLGETWSSPFHLTEPPEADAIKCRNIVANDYNCMFVPWRDNKYSGGTMDDIILKRSTDNGITWLPEQQITNHHSVNTLEDICCADSDVYIVWPRGGTDYALQFRASTNMGETWWPIEDICDTVTFSPTIAVTVDTTRVHVAWDDNRVAPSEIYYRRGFRLPVGITENDFRYRIFKNIKALPNPFSTNVRLLITGDRHKDLVSIKIYDINGKEMVVFEKVGTNDIVWDGRDKRGSILPAGVYFCEIKYDRRSFLEKVIKIK